MKKREKTPITIVYKRGLCEKVCLEHNRRCELSKGHQGKYHTHETQGKRRYCRWK